MYGYFESVLQVLEAVPRRRLEVAERRNEMTSGACRSSCATDERSAWPRRACPPPRRSPLRDRDGGAAHRRSSSAWTGPGAVATPSRGWSRAGRRAAVTLTSRRICLRHSRVSIQRGRLTAELRQCWTWSATDDLVRQPHTEMKILDPFYVISSFTVHLKRLSLISNSYNWSFTWNNQTLFLYGMRISKLRQHWRQVTCHHATCRQICRWILTYGTWSCHVAKWRSCLRSESKCVNFLVMTILLYRIMMIYERVWQR